MPHKVNWTKEKAALFWDYVDCYSFSGRVGKTFVKMVEKRIPFKGPVLDFGCGPGFLMEQLMLRKIPCFGADASDKSLLAAKERLSGNPFFNGVFRSDLPLAMADGSVNMVFLVETIEHISPDQFDFTLREIGRVLKPGGYLVVEGHNKEPVDKGRVICPDCGAIFHKIGHLRSFDAASLSELMAKYSFKKEFCWEASLKPFRSFYKIRHLASNFIKTVFNQEIKNNNLIYIGKKI